MCGKKSTYVYWPPVEADQKAKNEEKADESWAKYKVSIMTESSKYLSDISISHVFLVLSKKNH